MATQFDAVIVGAGFAGMYMLHKLRGQGLSARVYEAGDGLGGTWHWNRYPGARVDIESQEYGFSFDEALDREWQWSERYATQPELLAYVNHVADRFDLRRDIQLETRVTAAHYDEAANEWRVQTDQGDDVRARYCIMATGCLSTPKEIDLEGIGDFTGTVYKTFAWPREGVDFTGQRVGVIGTGSSAIQSIPVIAAQAAQLTVFQRTPNYCVPANNGPIPPEKLADWDANRAAYRAEAKASPYGALFRGGEAMITEVSRDESDAEYERRWQIGGLQTLTAYVDVGVDLKANAIAADFFARKIASIVKDPETADKLTPKTYPLGTKRLCVDTGYYATFNEPHVSLVDLRATPIDRITATGIKTSAGEHAFDALVLATGFDAMTGTLTKIDIVGRAGLSLRDKWADGPLTYLGLMIAGFPNLFTITGPGSPSVLTNMIMSIEQHVEWIADCIDHLETHQQRVIEAMPQAEAQWVAHVNEVADTTLYPQANSWYMGANVPGKPRVFLPYVGGLNLYTDACNDVVAKGYQGFVIGGARAMA
ncbi:MAG: flavin-containing monooxygenase [Sphingomonadaceae bacterium]